MWFGVIKTWLLLRWRNGWFRRSRTLATFALGSPSVRPRFTFAIIAYRRSSVRALATAVGAYTLPSR